MANYRANALALNLLLKNPVILPDFLSYGARKANNTALAAGHPLNRYELSPSNDVKTMYNAAYDYLTTNWPDQAKLKATLTANSQLQVNISNAMLNAVADDPYPGPDPCPFSKQLDAGTNTYSKSDEIDQLLP
jgi:hypothetical protein